MAEIFESEFNQMLSGKFKKAKRKINPKTINLSSTRITPLFSPKNNIISEHIISLVQNSKSYVYIPAFVITNEKLADELVRAFKRGIDVKIILDATGTSKTKNKVNNLRSQNIPVKIENYAGKIHSKSIIIDDKYIIAGSMNFTKSGENYNDENVLIIEDTRLAKYYKGFFEYLWNKIPDIYLKRYVNPESKESIGSCADGIDNDYDGKIDNKDPSCL